MKLLRSPSAARSAAAFAVTGLTLAAPAYAADTERTAFDARPADAAAGAPGKATRALKRALGEQGLVSRDPHTGTVRAAAKLDGALTGPSGRDGAAVALDYVAEHARALGLDPGGPPPGLQLARRAIDGRIQLITWRQQHRGIPSADTSLEAAIDDRGRLLSLTGAPAAELAPPTVEPALTAAEAVAAVTGAPPRRARTAAGDAERSTTFRGGARASLVLYQGEGGTRLAWRVIAPVSGTELADALVDAADGAVVKRANRVKFATAKVFPSNPDDSGQQAITLPPAWGTAAARLEGTRVHAFPDPNDVVGTEVPPAPQFETVNWQEPLLRPSDCPVEIVRCTWTSGQRLLNQDQSTTQLYYLVNTFLDHLAAAPIGFTDASGGYGAGDRIFAQSMDSANKTGPLFRDNASFATYPDGDPGFLDVFLFSRDGVRLDGVNDASLVFHEVTHGLTERLVTDADGWGALTIGQAAALAEGTSDFYALDYLAAEGLEPDTPLRFGEYLGNWLRETPIDGATLTYADLAGAEPHTDGEIWAQTLWSLRSELGVTETREVLTDALRIAPPEPSFLDMRNALLIAGRDEATDRRIWAVFAARGMGYFAASDGAGDDAPQVSDVDPYEPPPGTGAGTLRGTVRDEDAKPVAGASVTIGGDDLGAFLGTTTGADGRYALRGLEGVHPVVTAGKAAFEDDVERDVAVAEGDSSVQDFQLTRDWSSAAGGATIDAFSGPDNTEHGCGPGGLIDDSGDVVWGTSTGGQSIVVDLGAPVDVAAVRIDPAAGCGDDETASLGTADVLAATGPAGFTALTSPLTFTSTDVKTVFSGARAAVRYLKLVAKTSRSSGGDGAQFVDVAELQVHKTPGSKLGPTADTGAASGVGPAAATLSGRVKANGGAAPSVVFEYGTTTAYGKLVAATGSPAATAAVTGLAASTRYHFRVVALRDGRRYEGADATFVTGTAPVVEPPVKKPPAVEDLSVEVGSSKAKASRKGVFTFKVRFGDDVPEGTARVRAKLGGKTIASGRTAVAPGDTKTVRLKLTRSGRKAIKPGRKARKVRISVEVPGAEPEAKTIRLSRKR